MKATRLFLSEETAKQIEEKHRLDLPKQEPIQIKTMELPYYFNLSTVGAAYITTDNIISATICGREILLKNEKKVWDKIKLHLE